MTNNDVLRRLRYALDIKNETMVKIFELTSKIMSEADIIQLLKKEDEAGYQECPNEILRCFLDGLIILKRGPSDKESQAEQSKLTNNMILKKIRIALEIKEEEMLAILKLGNTQLSKYELSALFRKPGHKNYKECGNQFLRNFLTGLTKHYRTSA